MLPLSDTRVTFPTGDLTSDSTVLAVVDMSDSGRAGSFGVVTDISPFHPVDPTWPDQGSDRGTLVVDGRRVDVVDAVVGATDGDRLMVGGSSPVRRGEPGWAFVVVHVLAPGRLAPTVGQAVELLVEPLHREALSYGHTSCHLAALALNAALADRWRKPVELDGLGHPNFDRQAIVSSTIRPDGATDLYRLGKSLRRKGFDGGFGPDDASAAAVVANCILAGWVSAGADIRIEAEGPGLTDRRTWVCALPDGTERIPCGGTHLTSLAGVQAIEITLGMGDSELIMQTSVTRR